jgi:bifunctional oligoribonuclease and PAP phosphatase NrnA
MKSKTTTTKTSDHGSRQAIPVEAIRDVVERSRRVMVASHVDPDGDALGTMLACTAYLRSLGKEVLAVRDSDIPAKYRFLPGAESVCRYEDLPDDTEVDLAIILECPHLDRVGRPQSLLTDSVTTVNVDHHRDNAHFGQINWIDTGASSVGEMLYEYLVRVDYDVTSEDATCLYTAILTDTGRFRFSSTTPRTMQVAGELIERGADPQLICDKVYYSLTKPSLMLMGKVLESIEFHCDGRICLLSMTQSMLSASGAAMADSEGLVDFTLYGENVIAGAFFKEVGPIETRVSLRSRDRINVSRIAGSLGGGGHYNAAGCSIEKPLDQARQLIAQLLCKAIDG